MVSEQPRPTYSREQISKYFERLKLPEKDQKYDIAGLNPEDALKYLTLLQKYQLAAIPFENLTLHYSAHHSINVHPQALFTKIVGDNNGRGGYCMENNALFGTLLFSLGFNIYSAGARVNDGGVLTGWSHMVNIVTIGESKYHVDVGFGGNGPIVPMPLDRSDVVKEHIKPAATRLQWRNVPGNTDPTQRLWVYQHRRDEDSEFAMMYCFTELEFLPSDYVVMNYFTSTSKHVFFTRTIVLEKKILDDAGELAGQLIMSDKDLKWRIHGKKEKQIEFESEKDRLDALEEHLGIRFSEVERMGIQGLPSEIK
ncbi:arylamine N-acetyltransferase 1 [Macroventuria anomochaeta]|uniref:Arylamine N-acetyltransferase 1 n=1 Tax=Macroventuria anomochaeta TaxID=301207 RepID=A0ACB6S6I4_9PLEO|nr:arylamine N-acetyltransferase 1 [Macroventuria anomochaeta]KAF2628747.1 arylamine N-acetyltransferase 1 [Macroventuria anomochaeta]